MSEEQAPYNSTSAVSNRKDSSDLKTEPGTSRPLLFWIDTKVESTPNKREHWTKSQKRNASQKQAVRNAVQGLRPPRVPDESEHM